MSAPDPVRGDARMAGNVRRYHTWPVRDQQTVAHHSWNKARILLEIWPDAPREAIVYALRHDLGEVGTGDIPFPIKRENPDLKAIMDRLEDDVLQGMGVAIPHVSVLWSQRLKVCDLLEMWEYGMEEVLMGNLFAWPIIDRTLSVVTKMVNLWHDESRNPVRHFIAVREDWFRRAGDRASWPAVK